MCISEIKRNVALLPSLWRERGAIRYLLESDSFRFLKWALPGHYYSAVPRLSEVVAHVGCVENVASKEIPGVCLNEDGQLELLEQMSRYYSEMPFHDNPGDGSLRYYLDNGYFSYGDGITLYAILRYFAPKRIVEIGSGFSSALMLDVDELFLGGKTQMTFVEPFPERLMGLLRGSDRERITLEVRRVQEVDLKIFTDLNRGDVLFIDSSHVVKCGSDVVYLVLSVLPLLKPGVIVHVHDILWPFEYPLNWFEGGRSWNEAYLLRSFLQFNAEFEIVYWNAFMQRWHSDRVRELMPGALSTPSSAMTPGNASLWIRRVGEQSCGDGSCQDTSAGRWQAIRQAP